MFFVVVDVAREGVLEAQTYQHNSVFLGKPHLSLTSLL